MENNEDISLIYVNENTKLCITEKARNKILKDIKVSFTKRDNSELAIIGPRHICLYIIGDLKIYLFGETHFKIDQYREMIMSIKDRLWFHEIINNMWVTAVEENTCIDIYLENYYEPRIYNNSSEEYNYHELIINIPEIRSLQPNDRLYKSFWNSKYILFLRSQLSYIQKIGTNNIRIHDWDLRGKTNIKIWNPLDDLYLHYDDKEHKFLYSGKYISYSDFGELEVPITLDTYRCWFDFFTYNLSEEEWTMYKNKLVNILESIKVYDNDIKNWVPSVDIVDIRGEEFDIRPLLSYDDKYAELESNIVHIDIDDLVKIIYFIKKEREKSKISPEQFNRLRNSLTKAWWSDERDYLYNMTLLYQFVTTDVYTILRFFIEWSPEKEERSPKGCKGENYNQHNILYYGGMNHTNNIILALRAIYEVEPIFERKNINDKFFVTF